MCIDIDECLEDQDNCTDNSHCVNLIGSFACVCDSGYRNNGTDCCKKS